MARCQQQEQEKLILKYQGKEDPISPLAEKPCFAYKRIKRSLYINSANVPKADGNNEGNIGMLLSDRKLDNNYVRSKYFINCILVYERLKRSPCVTLN